MCISSLVYLIVKNNRGQIKAGLILYDVLKPKILEMWTNTYIVRHSFFLMLSVQDNPSFKKITTTNTGLLDFRNFWVANNILHEY